VPFPSRLTRTLRALPLLRTTKVPAITGFGTPSRSDADEHGFHW